ncbi:hypothetical protein ACTQ45_01135 [Fundicoccus sp. Sow4_D5]|uniref:hypothetical protein n=1 Tax=Fundicoccus sp. Sow4_D5 TaxID=3438782 RepID=UPI003F8DDF67
MIDHGIVESNTLPEPIVVDEYSVWEATDIEEFQVEVKTGEETVPVVHYRYQLKQYTKDDYILSTIKQNQTTSDLAIAELVEMMLGGV